MNVYDQVEKLLQDNKSYPQWADEMLHELRQIRKLLEKMQQPKNAKYDKDRYAYFAFVNKLRKRLRADIANDRYPQIDYQGRELGVNLKGWIYDKATTRELPAHEAFEVYRFLYDHRENLEKYLTT